MSEIGKLLKQLCPEGVPHKKLGEFATLSNSGVDKKINSSESEVSLLNFLDICRNKKISSENITATTTASSKKIVECNLLKGDIFITPSSETKDDLANAAEIVSDIPSAVYSYHIMRIRLLHLEQMNPSFIVYLFASKQIQDQIISLATGLTRFGLTKPKWESLKFPIPPIEIQNEIVSILDKLSKFEDGLKAELEAEIKARKSQYDYISKQLFNDSEKVSSKALGEIAEFSYGYTDVAQNEGDIRFLRITDIDLNGKIKPINKKYVSKNSDSSKYLVKAGDLLMARTGGTFGKTALIGQNENSVYASFLIRIRLNTEIMIPSFYWHFAQSQEYWHQAHSLVSKGGQPQFNANALKQIRVPVPSFEQQEYIVQVLDGLNDLMMSLSNCLPTEIKARRHQYEYHRDKLLTFKELGVA